MRGTEYHRPSLASNPRLWSRGEDKLGSARVAGETVFGVLAGKSLQVKMTSRELQKMAERECGRGRGLGVRFAVMTGVVLLSAAQMATGQAPQYQSPINEPTPQIVLPASPAITPNGVVVEDVIARVNDQIISRSDLERAEQQLQQDASQAGASQADLESRQKDLLRDLIDQQLLLSRGKALNINADAEVIRR